MRWSSKNGVRKQKRCHTLANGSYCVWTMMPESTSTTFASFKCSESFTSQSLETGMPKMNSSLHVTERVSTYTAYSEDGSTFVAYHTRPGGIVGISSPQQIIERINGKYLSWLDNNSVLKVCDLETERLVHAIASDTTSRLSSDGSLVVCYQSPGVITTRWAETGTILCTANVETDPRDQVSVEFIGDGTRIIVSPVKPDRRFGRGAQGVMLDAKTLSVLGRVSFSAASAVQQPGSARKNGQYLYLPHGSKLDLIRLQDSLVLPYPQARIQCDHHCQDALVDVQESELTSVSLSSVKCPRSCDLTISVDAQEVDSEEHAIVVSIIDSRGGSRQILQIPPLNGQSCPMYLLDIIEDPPRLIVYSDQVVMSWKIPTTSDEMVSLDSAFSARSFPYQSKGYGSEYDEFLYKRATLKKCECQHRQFYATFKDEHDVETSLRLYCDEASGSSPSLFFDGLLVLIEMFDRGDNAFRQAILQRVGMHISRTEVQDNQPETLLKTICQGVNKDNYAVTNRFSGLPSRTLKPLVWLKF
ncbi:hypothetical protein B0O80DRAFT_132988 [Mortierella sp. GBAus27b]|nr:hypothetical protein B0O80DRAFT_132988 [Mortierella sp. GBAus27b]